MKKCIYFTLTIVLLLYNPTYTMYYLKQLFETDDTPIEKKEETELIEKTKTPRHILIDISTLYQPNEKIAGEKIAKMVRDKLDLSIETFVFGVKQLSGSFFYPKSVGEEEKTTLFEFLEQLTIPSEYLPVSKKIIHTYHNEGTTRALPPVFSTFFLLKNEEQEERLRTYIKNEIEKNEFKPSLKKVLCASIDVMFNSREVNDIMELNNDMHTIASKLKQSGHTLILTGNIPVHAYTSFLSLTKAYPLKKLFEEKNCFLSGALQLLTPQKEFYRTIAKTCETDVEKFIIINEHKKNMLKGLCLKAQIIGFKPFEKEKEYQIKFNKKLEDALKN